MTDRSGYCSHEKTITCPNCDHNKTNAISYNGIVGFVLRQERRKAGASVKTFPWSRYNTCRIEKGNYNVNMMHLLEYGKALNTTPSKLVQMVEEMVETVKAKGVEVTEGYGPSDFDWSQVCTVYGEDGEDSV